MGFMNAVLGTATEVSAEDVAEELGNVLLKQEKVRMSFRAVRDLYVFTNWRIIIVDKQGIRGRKVECLTIPYRSITAFSVETAGTLDLDSELKFWIAGSSTPMERSLGKGANIQKIQRLIAMSMAAVGT